MKLLAKGNEAHPSLSVVKLQCRNNTITMSGKRMNAMTFDCKSVGLIRRISKCCASDYWHLSEISLSAIALPRASQRVRTSAFTACFISTGSPTASKCRALSFHS